MLISPNEPKKVRKLVKDNILDVAEDSFCEDCGADFLLITNRGLIGIQRKKLPQDFLASVEDNRLAKELAQLREFTEIGILLLEGKPRYTRDNSLMNGCRPSRYSKTGFRNLCRSIEFIEGIPIQWSDNLIDTVQVLKEIEDFFNKEKHMSLHIRPSPEPKLFILTWEERYLHWLQGLPSIKITRAMALAEVFKSPLELFSADIEALKSVPGIGDVIAEGIYNFLRGG